MTTNESPTAPAASGDRSDEVQMPDWVYMDDLGGRVPSEVRTAMNAYASEHRGTKHAAMREEGGG